MPSLVFFFLSFLVPIIALRLNVKPASDQVVYSAKEEHWDDPPPYKICVKHLLKAGGTFTIKLLESSGFHLCNEYETFNAPEKHFAIDLIRDPFEYYVSVWAFRSLRDTLNTDGMATFNNADGKGFKRHNTELDSILHSAGRLDNETAFLCKDLASSPTARHLLTGCCSEPDIKRFRSWMRLVNFDEAMNFYSHRVLQTHLKLIRTYGEWGFAKPDQTYLLGRFQQLAESKTHCLVHAESLVEDLRQCILLYQEIEPEARNVTFLDDLSNIPHNPSRHCEAQRYYDDDTLELVKRGDADIAQAFGYSASPSARDTRLYLSSVHEPALHVLRR